MILVDTAEPESIVNLLRQSAPVAVSPLNQMKMADYFFVNYEGKRKQFGRVQTGELIGNVDSMEDELRRYYNNADESNQIIEGLISPVQLYMKEGRAAVSDHSLPTLSTRDLGASVYCYPVQASGFIEHGHSFKTIRMLELYAWIYRLSQLGVYTYYTNNWEETARFLLAVYHNEQKAPESHNTFKRVFRPRITITEADAFTKALLFISSAYKLGVGDVKVKALTDKFANILDLATASVEDVSSCEGIGSKMAVKILQALRGE